MAGSRKVMGLQRKGMTALHCGMVDTGFLNFCYNLFCYISCARNYIFILHPFAPGNINTAFTGLLGVRCSRQKECVDVRTEQQRDEEGNLIVCFLKYVCSL